MICRHYDDPVAAYDRLAAHYSGVSHRRDAYLRGVEREIMSRIDPLSRSLLDVGAGDGSRAFRIASASGIARVVLAEPSREMTAGTSQSEVWPLRAEDLTSKCSEADGQFDVITCLWNVLGHVPTPEKRLHSLNAIAGLLAPGGKFFLDVNHRYNARSYGPLHTGARWVRDLLFPGENNGDALAQWDAGGVRITTHGHVFTHREVLRLAESANLKMEDRVVMDYENGRARRFVVEGNLLYVFRRSRMDSSSAPQTS